MPRSRRAAAELRERLARVGMMMALIVALLAPSALLAQPKFPVLTGRIVDEAGLLSPADEAQLTQQLAALEEKSTDQLVVYTTRSLQGYPIEDFGYQLGRHWGIGQKGKDNGIVLIVAPTERKVRIEVGRGLEGEMTDLMSKLIIENRILPAFRRGDFAGGIKAGVRDIQDVLLGDAEAVKERARGGRKPSAEDSLAPLIPIAFFLLVMFLIWRERRRQMEEMRKLPPGARPTRRAGQPPIIITPGNWSGGSSGGWSGGSGGGWSGGGGSFGGGGASGSW